MKALLLAFVLPAFLMAVGRAAPAIIPQPVSVQEQPGAFAWPPGTPVSAPAAAAGQVALLREYFGGLVGATSANAPIAFEASSTLSGEAYELDVTPKGIVLRAATPQGWANAIQTLRQLVPPERIARPAEGGPLTIPCVAIADAPRAAWRGLMLDCSRHFFTKDEVKKVIDDMALHKLNVFHWHLTDDQGWRLEIEKYPRLTSIGAFRGEGEERFGGYYTQENVREIVAYAAQRNVMVVPEIEMPGHSQALLAAYPEFSNVGGPIRVQAGIFKPSADVLDVTNPALYPFLADILAEVAALFPAPYLHIGGDEVDEGRWEANPRAVAFMKAQGMKNVDPLQQYFTSRIDAMAKAKGRRLICWETSGAPLHGVIVMCYRDKGRGSKHAIEAGSDVIICTNDWLYFDWAYAETPTDKVYSYNPIPEGLTPEQAKHILGYEATVWTEHIFTLANVEAQTFPRGCAMAEVFWSPAATHNLADFRARLKVHLERLKALGIALHKPGSDV